MTPPIGIGWEGCPYGDGDRVAAARLGDGDYLDAVRVTVRMPQTKRPSLWSRLKSWAENLFTDPDGDDE